METYLYNHVQRLIECSHSAISEKAALDALDYLLMPVSQL